MLNTTSLETIQALLVEEKLDCALVPADEVIGYPRLLVYMGEDYRKRERAIEISVQEQYMKDLPLSGYLRIQLRIVLPFIISAMTAQDVGSLLLFINQMIDLPGFELHEVEDKASYRYVLMTAPNGLNKTLLTSVMGVMMVFLDLFTETIERVAEGKSTFNELLEEVGRVISQASSP